MSLLRFAALAVLLGKALAVSAQQSTTIDLTGVQFRNATNQSRSSATPISPAFLYDYAISGNARGVGGVLGLLYPTATPLATILDNLSPGSSALLNGQGANNAGTHPFLVSDQRVDGSTVIASITVTYGFNIRIEIAANGIVSFSLTNVILQPSALVGYIQMTSGSAVISRTPGVIGGTITLEDFLGDPTLQNLVIEIRSPGATTPLETHVINPTAAGTWYVQTALRGTFDVTAKSSHWLRKLRGSVSITNAGATNLNFSLKNGDINGDNAIDIGDYSILSTQFNTAGPEADITGDENVDIGDYSILSANYNQFGDD